MAWPDLPRPRALLFSAVLILAGAVVVGAGVVLSGVYNVAASAKHFYITDRLIKLVLWRSIDTHSAGIDVPSLEDPGLARLGGQHYVTGCEPCHGAPGVPQSPIAAGMYPAAPRLGEVTGGWSDAELFWIVRHGLKFTGMPQWAGTGRTAEVWPVVAFLRTLPSMTPQEYAALAEGPGDADVFALAPASEGVRSCARCHGDAVSPPISDLVPPLQGQTVAYLERALEDYARNRRQSGIMEPLAVALSQQQRVDLATAYAAMAMPGLDVLAAGETKPATAVAVPPEALAEGRRIAEHGLQDKNVAACLSCHSGGRSPQFARLDRLSEAYIAEQVRLFRDGVRGDTPYGAIMHKVVQRLSDEQIDAVAAYIASRDETATASAAAVR
jgi:cytochrome c553